MIMKKLVMMSSIASYLLVNTPSVTHQTIVRLIIRITGL